MKRLFIFAERRDQALEWVHERGLVPYQYVIPFDVHDVMGCELEEEQIITIGHWYNNHRVSMAYDYAVIRARRKNAGNH
jgi:hypothetical protein